MMDSSLGDSSDEPGPNTPDTSWDRLEQPAADRASQQLATVEREFAEFKLTSEELEQELLDELKELQERNTTLGTELTEAKAQANSWKDRYVRFQAEATDTEERLLKQIEVLREASAAAATRVRKIEIENDDMERNGRIVQSSLVQLEQRNADLLEQLAFAETVKEELAITATQLQRTRDELRDALEELSVLQQRQSPQVVPSGMSPSKSLRKIAEMRGQAESLEGKIYHFKRRLSSRKESRGHQRSFSDTGVERNEESLDKTETLQEAFPEEFCNTRVQANGHKLASQSQLPVSMPETATTNTTAQLGFAPDLRAIREGRVANLSNSSNSSSPPMLPNRTWLEPPAPPVRTSSFRLRDTPGRSRQHRSRSRSRSQSRMTPGVLGITGTTGVHAGVHAALDLRHLSLQEAHAPSGTGDNARASRVAYFGHGMPLS